MKERTAARRYGRALFDLVFSASLGSKAGGEKTSQLAKDILLIKEAAEKVPSLVKGLSDERINLNRRIACADAVAKELNISHVAANALKLLVRKSRMRLVRLIMDDFTMRMEHRERLAVCRAAVAEPSFSSEVKNKIEEIVGRALSTTARCDVTVSPSIIGGFVLSIGDSKYDASIRGKIEGLKEELFKSA